MQIFLHFLHFINNFSVTGASTFLLLSILHLPFYHNQFGITKILNSKPIYVEEFAKQNIFIYDLFNTENEFKTWDEMKISYNLNDKFYFNWRRIVSSILIFGKK